MERTIELGYVRLEIADVPALGGFLTEVIGLAPSEPTTSGEATWTDDDAVQRIIVGDGPANDVTVIGFEAVGHGSFESHVDRMASAGYALAEGDATLCEERRVDRLVATDAPWGGRLEICEGLARTAEVASTPLMPGGFDTVGQGFGHAVVATMAFDETVRLLTEGLGMRQTDWIVTEIMEGIELEVRFFHCNRRHHTMAVARAPFEMPQTLHHLMVEATEFGDVGASFDRAYASGLPIPNGLGMHDNDRTFSYYVQSPAGFQVETGFGGRQIDESWSDDRRYDRISAWGHQPVIQVPSA